MERRTALPHVSGIVLVVAVVAALALGKALFVPFVLAMLISLVLAPLVARAQRAGVPRVPAVIGVVTLTIVLLGWIAFVVAGQFVSLGSRLPDYKENFSKRVASVRGPVAPIVKRVEGLVKEVLPPEPGSAERPVVDVRVVNQSSLARVLQGALGSAVAVAGTAAIVVLLVVFFLIFAADIRDRFIRLVGDSHVNITTRAMNEGTSGVSRFLLAQFCLNTFYGICFGAIAWAFGVPGAALLGFLAAVLRFIPYVGAWFAAGAAILLTLAVSEGWSRPLGLVGSVILLELLTNGVLEPVVYGRRTGLSPLGVVIAAVFWAWLWGGVGLLLAVPLTGCVVVISRHVPSLRFLALILGSEPPLEPRVRLYHRLLARDLVEAADVMEESCATIPREEALDRLIVPVLAMLEEDRREGRIDEGKAEQMRHDVRELAAAGAPEAVQPARGFRALCLPSAEASDEVVAELLARHLSLRGIQADAVPFAAMATEKVEQVSEAAADLVCISALPPGAATQARYLYKRLRLRHPDLPIIVALWTEFGDVKRLARHVATDDAAILVSSVAEAEREIRRLAAQIILARDPGKEGAAEAARLAVEEAPAVAAPPPGLRERFTAWWRRARLVPGRA